MVYKYLDMPKTSRLHGFTIHFKFSYEDEKNGNEFKFSMPNFGIYWNKNDVIPDIVRKKIGLRRYAKLQQFVNECVGN